MPGSPDHPVPARPAPGPRSPHRPSLAVALVAAGLAPGCGPRGNSNSDLPLPIRDLAVALHDLAVPRDATVGRDLPPPTCVGVAPPQSAYGARPAPLRYPADSGLDHDAGVAPSPRKGDPAPLWALSDFQTTSCGHGATYGLDQFRGRPLAVALWAGW